MYIILSFLTKNPIKLFERKNWFYFTHIKNLIFKNLYIKLIFGIIN